DERGVEADAELADQLRILALIAGQLLDEPLRAGMSNRAELLDDLVARHADAVVRDRNRLRALVDRDDDVEVRGLRGQLRARKRLEAQLVVRVRSVRDQLAEEDLAIAVQRMHHEVKQLLHLGLESVGRLGRLHWQAARYGRTAYDRAGLLFFKRDGVRRSGFRRRRRGSLRAIRTIRCLPPPRRTATRDAMQRS